MNMKHSIVLPVVIYFLCGYFVNDGHAASQDMSILELSVLDGYLQLELIQMLSPEMDREVQKYNMLSEMCETELNKTVDDCIKCAESASCGGSGSGGQSKGSGAINIAMNVANNIMGPMLDHKTLLLGGATGAITKATLKAVLNKQTLKTMENIGKTIGKGFSSAYKGISKGLGKAFKGVKNTVGKAYKGVKNTVNKAYNGVKNTFNSAGKAIKGGISKMFGKRDESESMDPCILQSCDSCRRIDTDTRTGEEIINDVCKSVQDSQKTTEAKIIELENHLMSVYEKTDLIISKLSYDFSQSQALSGNWNFRVTEVKAVLDGKPITINPTMTINVNDLASVAKSMAQTIYDALTA